MRKLVYAATVAALGLAGPCWAQGTLEKGKSAIEGAGSGAATQMPGGMSMDKVVQLVEQQGYSKVSNLMPKGNMLAASAVDSSGSPVDLLVNPTSGKVESAMRK
jgi:hypothetical protein